MLLSRSLKVTCLLFYSRAAHELLLVEFVEKEAYASADSLDILSANYSLLNTTLPLKLQLPGRGTVLGPFTRPRFFDVYEYCIL